MLCPLARHQPANHSHRIGVLFLVFIILSQAFEQKINRHYLHAERKKEKVFKDSKNREDKSKSTSSSSEGGGRSGLLSRHPRDTYSWSDETRSRFGRAVYLAGRQVLKLAPYHRPDPASILPKGPFTVEAWLKPEGGQSDPATILVLHDACDGDTSAGNWTVGVRTWRGDGEMDARVYFSLRTQRSVTHSTIISHEQYSPGRWVHVAVSYDGARAVLYINSARVMVAWDQKGHIFGASAARCKEIHLGGNVLNGDYFRGSVDAFRLWSIPLTHHNISKYLYETKLTCSRVDGLLFQDTFNDMTNWRLVRGKSVEIVPSDIPYQHHDTQVTTPMCGRTVCDNPDVISSYSNNHQLRDEKVIRYRIIKLMDNDGLNPVVTSEQIFIQHEALNTAFQPYNITFDLYVENINNTALRKRLLMIGCEPSLVGDGVCQHQCKHTRTGDDGGDCDVSKKYCDYQTRGDGKCDFGCNRAYHNYDDGDCCLEGADTHYTCYNYSSPARGYLGIDEYRDILQVSGEFYLNVFFASTTTDQLIGLATFPWEKHVYSHQGGIVVQPETFGRRGQTDSLVHEIGHNLGLWHVHHGVSELDCDDPCVEREPSLEHGDLCGDTAPTPQNLQCHDPDPSQDQCGILSAYTNTPFRNYMSYADDNCTNEFSPQQAARMHCYLDLVYRTWTTNKAPSPVPLPPRVLWSDASSVTIAWIPPFSLGWGVTDSRCTQCAQEGAFHQFAHTATSPAPHDFSGEWLPVQATGAPDANKCDASTRAWMPKVSTCSERLCQLDLTLRWPVKPARLAVWVTWNAHKGLSKIRLFYEEGPSSTLTNVQAFCDVPYTVTLGGHRKLRMIRIYTRSPYVAIDAVEVVSQPISEHCILCPPIKYKISRSPQFTNQESSFTSDLRYSDLDLERGKTYTYWVSVLSGSMVSSRSPPFVYTHGQHYCGDGQLNSQSLEECDDGNAVAGDGCSPTCSVEQFFHCKDSPSLCYLPEGDGVCEQFEKRSSIRDCGFYTPPGFTDQWAESARANPVYQLPMCPESAVPGPPANHHGCSIPSDASGAVWYPCGSHFQDGNFWIEVYFPSAVVATKVNIYIASDGRVEHDPRYKNISVHLITANNESVTTATRDITIDCSNPVAEVPVYQDLSKPFFQTKGVRISFHSYNVSIAAVRLRSSPLIDPITLGSCGPSHVYNPRSGRCVLQNCSTTCSLFSLPDSQPKCTGNREGDTCIIHCRQGYAVSRDSEIAVCAGGRWVTSNSPSCRPLDCRKPDIPFASVVCPNGTTFNNTCRYKCARPARQRGIGTTIRCQADGFWSAPRATCHVRCPPPLSTSHAKLLSRHCRKGKKTLMTSCRFRCKKGFHVQNEKPKRRVYQRVCGREGEWEGPSCVRVQCPSLPISLKGEYRCTDRANTRSRCVLKCRGSGQKRQKITCRSNGSWSDNLLPCRSHRAAECPSLSPSRHFDTNCTDAKQPFSSTCEVGCRKPLHDLVYIGKKSRDRLRSAVSLASGQVVHKLVCTGSSKWFPHPAHLRCLEQCDTSSLSDSWCDAVNNREYCNWDEGDCCASTSGGVVYPFPKTCTTACSCRNPRAKENMDPAKVLRKKKGGKRKIN